MTEDDGEELALFEAVLERMIKHQAAAYGNAATYDTAITIAGYGAFFALWGGLSKDLTPATRGLSAALIGVSLVFYIGWQITSMFTRHRFDRDYMLAVKQTDAAAVMSAWSELDQKLDRAIMTLQGRFWRPVFGLSYATGMFGVGVLIYNAAAMAFGWPQFTGRV